ncbi:MAG: hypothetical protein ACE5KZ_06820 [Candidatus Scalinduaceae bacterium]
MDAELTPLERSGILLFLLLLTYTNYAVGAKADLTITWNITNIPPNSPNLVHLYSYYGGELSEIASASVNEQGDFKLEQQRQKHW